MHFNYEASNVKGKNCKGIINAIDKGDAISQLREQGLTATKLVETDRSQPQSFWSIEIGSNDIHKAKIKKKRLLALLNQIGIMMKAGVNLSMAMEVLIESEKSKKLKAILKEINTDLFSGLPLSEAMSKFNTFPKVTINIIQSGEANGRLDVAFERAAQIVEKEIALTAKIKGAMAYPLFLAGLTLCLVLIMSMFVLPSFVSVFSEFGAELPALTLAVIAFSDFLINEWYFVLGGVIFFVVSFILLKKNSPPFAFFLSRIALRVPLIGKIIREANASRFCRTMASLVDGGVDIVSSLEISRDVIKNIYTKNQISQVVSDVKVGSAIYQSMAKFSIFDPLLVSMIKVGEESGMLFETLIKMSELYEQQTDESTKKLTTMMEPAMTIIIAVVVGTVIISIVIPMFGMYGVISGGGF